MVVNAVVCSASVPFFIECTSGNCSSLLDASWGAAGEVVPPAPPIDGHMTQANQALSPGVEVVEQFEIWKGRAGAALPRSRHTWDWARVPAAEIVQLQVRQLCLPPFALRGLSFTFKPEGHLVACSPGAPDPARPRGLLPPCDPFLSRGVFVTPLRAFLKQGSEPVSSHI